MAERSQKIPLLEKKGNSSEESDASAGLYKPPVTPSNPHSLPASSSSSSPSRNLLKKSPLMAERSKKIPLLEKKGNSSEESDASAGLYKPPVTPSNPHSLPASSSSSSPSRNLLKKSPLMAERSQKMPFLKKKGNSSEESDASAGLYKPPVTPSNPHSVPASSSSSLPSPSNPLSEPKPSSSPPPLKFSFPPPSQSCSRGTLSPPPSNFFFPPQPSSSSAKAADLLLLQADAEGSRGDQDAIAEAQDEADAAVKTRQTELDELAASRETARISRMQALSAESLQKVFSKNFHKKITEEHEKKMKELVEERSKLDEKAISLGDRCAVVSTQLFTYMTGTVTIYGAVNMVMLASDLVGFWRAATLLPFIYLLNFHKDTAFSQLHSIKDDEMMMIKSKRVELIRKMNQLRCIIDATAPQKKSEDEIKMLTEFPDEMKFALTVKEEAAGDNFHNDCEKILATIPEPDYEAIERKINVIFISGLLVLGILAVAFLFHALIYILSPSSAPLPPAQPPSSRNL